MYIIPENNHYRVDMLLATTGTYVEYTSRKRPLELSMAEAYGRGLRRQGQPGRIVNVQGEKVIAEWGRDGRDV